MSNFIDKAKNKLKNLLVKELSLVDRGANQGAKVVLFKHESNTDDIISIDQNSLNKGDLNMNLEEVLKKVGEVLESKLSPLNSKVEELEKKMNKPSDEKDEVKPGEKEPEKKEPAKKVDESPEGDTELQKALEVVKAQKESFTSQLEAIKKEFEAAKKLADEYKAATERAELEKRIEKEFPYLQGTMDQKVELLKSVEGNEFALSVLKSANATNKSLFGSYGHSVSVTKSTEQKIEDLAKAYQKDNPEVDFYTAYEKALSTPEGQLLYKESLEN